MRKCGPCWTGTVQDRLSLLGTSDVPFVRAGMAEVYGQHAGVVVDRTPNEGKESSMRLPELTRFELALYWTTIPCPSTHVRALTFPSVNDLSTTTTLNNDPPSSTATGDDSLRRRLPSKATDDVHPQRRPSTATDDLLPTSLPPTALFAAWSQRRLSVWEFTFKSCPNEVDLTSARPTSIPSAAISADSVFELSSFTSSRDKWAIRNFGIENKGRGREYGDELKALRRVSVWLDFSWSTFRSRSVSERTPSRLA